MIIGNSGIFVEIEMWGGNELSSVNSLNFSIGLLMLKICFESKENYLQNDEDNKWLLVIVYKC